MENFPTDQFFSYIFRWIHYFSGVCWIGLLYFFNLVNGPFQGKIDASIKKVIVPELMPRALFWFRWAAMFTLISGIVYLIVEYMLGKPEPFKFFGTPHGQWISLGMLLAIVMWFNVWFIIWPSQKIIIRGVVSGNPADPSIPKRAILASRVNTYLSIPMLFLMGAGKHIGQFVTPLSVNGLVILVSVGVVGGLLVWHLISISAKIKTEV